MDTLGIVSQCYIELYVGLLEYSTKRLVLPYPALKGEDT